jgi:predicted anti-sigma-YlaC factor YlaD
VTSGRFRRKRVVTRCEDAQEAISARLDDERHPVPGAALETHLGNCQACRGFEAEVVDLGRRAGLRSHRVVPDDLMAVLAPLLKPTPRPDFPLLRPRRREQGYRPGWARTAQWAGAIVAAVLVSVALPLGLGSQPRLVPTRPPSPCTIGLIARHLSGEG